MLGFNRNMGLKAINTVSKDRKLNETRFKKEAFEGRRVALAEQQRRNGSFDR
jgi:hypothetical protein